MADEPQQQPQDIENQNPQVTPQRPGSPTVIEKPEGQESEERKHTIPPELPYQKYHMLGKLARGGWKRISINTVQSDDGRFTITQVDPTRRSKWFLLKDMETGESYEEPTMTEAKKKAKEILEKSALYESLIEKKVRSYRVWMKSTPGFYSQYDGYVDVQAENEEDAKEAAYSKLRNTSFPDRGRSMWKFEKVEERPLGSKSGTFKNQLLKKH